MLENVGLTAAFEWALGEAVRQQPPDSACRGRFSCPDDLEDRLALYSASRIQVYRMVQEALSKAARHSDARELSVTAALDADGTFTVTVEDDGCGFDAGTAACGRGLANIRSRASLVGARATWAQRPSGGTVFRLQEPL